MIGFQVRKFCFLFRAGFIVRPSVGNHVEGLLVSKRQFPADFGIVEVGGLMRQPDKAFSLRGRKRRLLPVCHNADMVDRFQQREQFKGIGRFCRTLLFRPRAFSDHALDLAARIRPTGRALIKGALAEKNLGIC